MEMTMARIEISSLLARALIALGLILVVGLSAGCSPPVVEDLRFQNVPASARLSGQITNGATPLSESSNFKLVNGVTSMNNGQSSSASPSFRLTGGITYVPAQ